jgi:hypothetical protein
MGAGSSAACGIVRRLSQEMALTSVIPCSGPSATSERIPQMARVIGAQVTVASAPMAASRLSTQTGRRPAGGPRSAQ